MLIVIIIILFITIGLVIGFFCDRYFGDSGILIGTTLFLPIAFITGQFLNYLVYGECVIKSNLEQTLNSFLIFC